jgi:hypothetical protein
MTDIKYRRAGNNEWQAGDHVDYWIELNGRRVGYVHADRAGRQSGTMSRWFAYDLDGTKLVRLATYTFKSLKEQVERVYSNQRTETVAEMNVASWSGRAREAVANRDQSIRDMRAEGASLRRIAEVSGMSHQAVAKILDK